MSECSCQTKQISPYRCVVFCFVVLLDAASLTQTQQMMGSGRQSGLGLSNVKPEPSHTHTHTHSHTTLPTGRELACPSGSEGTDGPSKRCTADPCPLHPARRQLGGGRHGGGGREGQHGRQTKGPRVPRSPKVTSRAKSSPGSRVQALQDLRALVPHLTHPEPPKNVSAQGAPARSPAPSTDTTGANRSQHVPTRQPAAGKAATVGREDKGEQK